MDLLNQLITSFNQQTPDNTTTDASVLLPFSNEPNPKLLLCRRANHLNSHAGEVALPGGKTEPEDTNNIATALRETHEETGIAPNLVKVIGELPTQSAKNGITVKPIVGIVPANVALTPEESEVARLFWVNLTDLTEDNISPYHTTFKGTPFTTASFQLEDEIIWGLTGRIIASLHNHVFQKNLVWQMVMPS